MRTPILALASLILATAAFAQSKQKIAMNMDKVGNVEVVTSMTMPASQWDLWQETVGNNPAALKRETQRSMPAYVLRDFDLKRNDMERSFELKFTALGMCKVDKRGNWIFETGVRNADITELGDAKFMYVDNPQEFGGSIQQVFTISFPEEASDIEVGTDAFGKTVFTFDMQTPGQVNASLLAGSGLMIVGLAWASLSLIAGPKMKE
ncbi:hypothetical protein [Pelagicoccus albus]|uniref:Uncharacterized protein n=1 Tax=Pelagicoccus albus TaxID=415222 RepID=A0A7X1B5V0_9BACT|nr:hypothetical protein [Pelagicoccus albus]MBC2605098.1 hypothetical protein [Pelagicoccus albus]